MCWRSCLRTNTLAFNTCRVNRRIFTAVYQCGLKRLQFSCRGHSLSYFTNYLIGPTFQGLAETEFIKANAAEKGRRLRGGWNSQPCCSRSGAGMQTAGACRSAVYQEVPKWPFSIIRMEPHAVLNSFFAPELQ